MQLADHLLGIARHRNWLIRKSTPQTEPLLVIASLEFGEFEPVSGRYDDDAIIGRNNFTLYQLFETRERDPGVRAREQPGAIRPCTGVGELFFARLQHEALGRDDRLHGLG